jgi:hypothetical protein
LTKKDVYEKVGLPTNVKEKYFIVNNSRLLLKYWKPNYINVIKPDKKMNSKIFYLKND